MVYRVHKTKDYTVISNHHLRDKQLSLKAKGLLSLMLSLPDDWDYTQEGLAGLSLDKLCSINSAMKELEARGYLKTSRERLNNGQLGGTIYDIYEYPSTDDDDDSEHEPIAEKPILENPILDNPILEKPILENQGQLNTNRINTNRLNTELQNTVLIKSIVEYLNSATGSSYKAKTQSTVRHIMARLNEGYTGEDFKRVIDNKVEDWKGTEYEKFLRPETLFGNKFESYLQQAQHFKPQSNNPFVNLMQKGWSTDDE